MAIRREDGTFEPGYIYELRCCIDDQWYPFYVGETTDLLRRRAEHAIAGRSADDTSTSVYQYIRTLDTAGIPWNIFDVAQYDQSGPEDLENQYIIQAIQSGANLMNEKKGNETWMAEMRLAAADMTRRGIDSYREYRRVTEEERAARRQRVRDQAQKHISSKIPEVQAAIDEWAAAPVDPNWRPPPIHDTLAVIRRLQEQQAAHKKPAKVQPPPPDRSAQSEIWDGATQEHTANAAWRAMRYFEETGETQLAEYWQQIYQDRLNKEQ